MSTAALLNLGCGRRFHRAWTNLDFAPASPDVIAHDLSKPLPFESNHFAMVYCSHVLEHFDRESGERFLIECVRVLRPGGTLRVVVPDLELLAKNYIERLATARLAPLDEKTIQRYQWSLLHLVDQMVRTKPGGAMLEFLRSDKSIDLDDLSRVAGSEIVGYVRTKHAATCPNGNHAPTRFHQLLSGIIGSMRGLVAPRSLSPHAISEARFRATGEVHRWMYDEFSLSELFQNVGVRDVVRCSATTSRFHDWAAFHLDSEPDGVVYKPESLFLEGSKPAKGADSSSRIGS